MKTMLVIETKKGAERSLLLLPLCAALLTGCASLPNDGANTKMVQLRNQHATRYCEIFLVGGNALTGDLKANVYNTSDHNGWNKTNKDSVPEALVAKLDLKAVKQQYHVLGASLNGPKFWQLDWVNVPTGELRDFNGLKAAWVGELNLRGMDLKDKAKMAYHPTTIARKTAFGYNQGTRVFLMDDPEGNTWIMKGLEIGTASGKTYKGLVATLDSDRKLPPGWKGRSVVLDRNLILIPKTGIATIVPDDLFNVYDKTGPGYSNFKP